MFTKSFKHGLGYGCGIAAGIALVGYAKNKILDRAMNDEEYLSGLRERDPRMYGELMERKEKYKKYETVNNEEESEE